MTLSVISTFWASLNEHWLQVALTATGFLAIMLMPRPLARLSEQSWMKGAVLVALVLIGIAYAWQLKWIGDDAFISFRYARHLLEGQGLVFNTGERVEGYTDFLWVLLIAAGMSLGVHPVHVSLALSMAAFALVICLLYAVCSREREGGHSIRGVLLFAPLLAAGNYVIASYGTSGLETMFVAACVLCALWLAQDGRILMTCLAGLMGIAGTLAHPDHLIFYGALGLALALHGKPLRQLLAYGASFALVFVPYYLWRWQYYGDFWPNTYYAKSANLSYFSQGGIYLLVSGLSTGMFMCAPLALIGLWSRRNGLYARFALIGLPLYLGYVAKIGGDFMLGRLLVTPALLIYGLSALGFGHLLETQHKRLSAILGVVAVITLVPTPLIQPGDKTWGIADERTFYPLNDWRAPRVYSLYSEEADVLREHLLVRGLRPSLATGGVGIVGYETDLPIFDMFGLTNRSVARRPIAKRGRPGHEKIAGSEDVFASGVEFSHIPVYPEPYAGYTHFRLGDFDYFLVRHVPGLIETLRKEAGYRNFREFITASVTELAHASPDERACRGWFLREFYFAAQSDPEKRAQLIMALSVADPALSEFSPILLEKKGLEDYGYRSFRQLSFSKPFDGWQQVGNAFADGPALGPIAGQETIVGAQGPLLNSYRRGTGNAAVGLMRSPPIVLEGDVLSFRIGGGRAPGHLGLRLLVDGVPVREATGCNSDIMREGFWNIRPWRGRKAQFEFEDSATGDYAHLLVDEIIEWSAPPKASAPAYR